MGISLGTWLGLLWGSRAIVLAFTSWDSPKGLRGWMLNRLWDIHPRGTELSYLEKKGESQWGPGNLSRDSSYYPQVH